MAIPCVVDLTVWQSLLTSNGNTNRPATACDCATILTSETAQTLFTNGYKYVGRYLTGTKSDGESKALSKEELVVIFGNNLQVFPIYQSSANIISYFTETQALKDAEFALEASSSLGFMEGTTIFFAVDVDAYDFQITANILPYFKKLKETFDVKNTYGYLMGVYGSRNACTRVYEAKYAEYCFVGDMSTGYSENLGYPLPEKWCFDQIVTKKIGENNGVIEIDHDACSELYLGESRINSSEQRDFTWLGEFEDLDEFVKIAIDITCEFETGGEKYSSVVGNFDRSNSFIGTGISFGIMQYNFKSSLLSILSKMIELEPNAMLEIFGSDYNTLVEKLSLSLAELINWCSSISNPPSYKLSSPWNNYFIELGKNAKCQELQRTALIPYVTQAFYLCDSYSLTTCRGFALAYEIAIQQWSLSDSYDAIMSQITQDSTELEIMNILISHISNPDSLARKIIIANGTGSIGSTTYNMSDYRLTDDPFIRTYLK